MPIDFDLADAISYNERHPHSSSAVPQLVAFFQSQQGLNTDGKLGPDTLAALQELFRQPVAPFTGENSLSPDRATVCARCHAATAETVYYALGAGGSANLKNCPWWPTWPWNAKRQCDCSAFVCGMLEFPRGDGDWGTTKLVTDAVRFDKHSRKILGPGPETRFKLVAYIQIPRGLTPAALASANAAAIVQLANVRPSDVIVRMGTFDKNGKRLKPGHTGIVVEIKAGAGTASAPWYENVSVVDCRPSSSGDGPGHAVALRDASAWHYEAVIIRLKTLV